MQTNNINSKHAKLCLEALQASLLLVQHIRRSSSSPSHNSLRAFSKDGHRSPLLSAPERSHVLTNQQEPIHASYKDQAKRKQLNQCQQTSSGSPIPKKSATSKAKSRSRSPQPSPGVT